MKNLLATLLLSFVTLVSITVVGYAKGNVVYFDISPDGGESVDFGWMQGAFVVSEAKLSDAEAQSYCLGKKPTAKVKTYSKAGEVRLNLSKKHYLYLMVRDVNSYEPNLKFELKEYELENQVYKLYIDDQESGQG